MAAANASGDHIMRQVSESVGVDYFTVSGAVQWQEGMHVTPLAQLDHTHLPLYPHFTVNARGNQKMPAAQQ